MHLVPVKCLESNFLGHAKGCVIILPGVPVGGHLSLSAFRDERVRREGRKSPVLKCRNGLDPDAALALADVLGGTPARDRVIATNDDTKSMREKAIERRPSAANFVQHEVKVLHVAGLDERPID